MKIIALGTLICSLNLFAGAIERIEIGGEYNQAASKVLANVEKECILGLGGVVMGDIKIKQEQKQDPDRGVMTKYIASLDCGYH